MSARTTEPSWARHYQDEWSSRAGDPRLPYWLRVAALAYGSHKDNGHARFKRGEIALILGSPDPRTGEIVPYTNVGRAIADAADYGWIDPDSFWGCLIVPAHAVKKGPHGSRSTCPVHVRRHARTRGANRSLSERNGVTKPTPDERFETRTAHSVSGSERKPLSLISPPPQPTGDPKPEDGDDEGAA